ncbi:MAG: AAA family ATPase [Methanobrevibacter sp.]|jgi:hypothetical protein|nr:AAA family ATPase [Candidatus Methanovirga procula]
MIEEDIMNSLSLGLSEFDDIIKQSKIYVDKTRFIKKMMDQGRKYYFLSRPRRFGKTLFLSTLENFFNGKKELFKDTYIYDNWDWSDEYPVLRIYMNDLLNNSSEELKEDIFLMIENIAQKNNIKLSEKGSFMLKFKELIEKLSKFSKHKEIVVLIDEYDAPIIDNINNTELADENRKILQNFYNVLKNSEKYIKFVFITGISKFTKTSIFSKFNNLTELTLDKDYSTICGITHNELKKYYHNHIQIISKENNCTYNDTIEKINHFYDGYSWDGTIKVFNPNSTLRALSQKKFSSYWFSTGTPSFIAEIFKKKKITQDYFQPTILKETELDAIDPDNINETTLLFQAGYLTIKKEFTKNDEIYFSLKIPNFEVQQAYKDNLLNLYIEKFGNKFKNTQQTIWDEIFNGKCEKLSQHLRAFITGIPYYNRVSMDNDEKWKIYSTIFTIWAQQMDYYLTVETAIEDGRIDFILENNRQDQTIIIGMKYTADQNKTLNTLINEAFKQINKKKYWWAYTGEIKLMALAIKDIKIDDGYITNVKCQLKDIKKEEE